MKRLIAILLALMLVVPTCLAVAAEEAISFKDVDSTTTQGQAILKLATAGVLSGYPDGTFKPDQPITRGELSKVINKIFGYTEADTEMFSDVDKSKDWYYNEVAIAKKAGYIKGYEDGTFRGENNMTREEACTILTRVGGLYDLGLPAGVKDTVSEWALPYVNTVIISGFMTLEADNAFRATEKITRGEFCEAFSKFVQVKEPEVVPPEDDKKEDKKEENKENNKENTGSSNTGSNNNSNSNNNTNNGDDEVDPPVEDEPIEEEPDDYATINAEIVENLNIALTELENFEPIDEWEIKLVNIGIECINIVLPYADSNEITDDFIEDVCASQIKSARNVWKNMSSDEKTSFQTTVVPEFNMGTVDYLSKLFGIY